MHRRLASRLPPTPADKSLPSASAAPKASDRADAHGAFARRADPRARRDDPTIASMPN
jgi:hypothetical protein